jgi:hypothetical protein
VPLLCILSKRPWRGKMAGWMLACALADSPSNSASRPLTLTTHDDNHSIQLFDAWLTLHAR